MSDNKMKVLVYGATSVQGAPVVKRLLEQSFRVRALVHHPDKAPPLLQAGAEVDLAELADRSSLEATSRDVDAVFLLLPQIIDRALIIGYIHNAVEAATASGIKLLVFTTSGPIPPEPTDVLHFEIKREVQAYLQQSSVPSIVLRPTVYLENLSIPPIPVLISQQRIVPFPYASEARVSWITVDDQAAFAVETLKRPELAGSIFDIGGPEAITGNELAARFSRVVGHPVHYYPVSPDDFEQQLKSQMGEVSAREVANVYRWHLEYGTEPIMTPVMADVLQKLPIKLTTVEQWAARLFKQSRV